MSEEAKSVPTLSGSQNAALLLMTLGEHEAAEVLKHMEPKEVQMIGSTMSEMQDVTQGQISSVLDTFIGSVGDQSSLSIGANDYLKKVLKMALGNEKANSILSRISMSSNSKGLEALKWMDPRAVSEIIKNEHAQIIAIVMVYLDSDQASEVLKHLPDEKRADVLMRIAKLDGIHPAAISELDSIMERHFDSINDLKVSNLGGIKVAAGILNNLSSDVETKVIEDITEIDAETSAKIQDQMFIFENLLELDDRGVQTLLREISSDSLIVALKGSSPEMRDKILKNMSKRAAEMLQDDLESKGPVRLAEVEEAQKTILTVARKMADDGQIMLGGGGDDYV